MTQHLTRALSRARLLLVLLTLMLISPLGMASPVLSVSVDGAPAVSFEFDQFCDFGKPEACFGFGDDGGDLFLGTWELTADPDPFVAGTIDFYNASFSDTISIEASILFPMAASYAAADLELSTGIVTSVFGGGALDISVAGLIDGAPVIDIFPGSPFSVCDDLFADPSCQDTVLELGTGPVFAGPIDIVSSIGVVLNFDLTPDTSASFGFDPGAPFGGGTFFAVTPVPVPPAMVLFLSGLGLAGIWRRRLNA